MPSDKSPPCSVASLFSSPKPPPTSTAARPRGSKDELGGHDRRADIEAFLQRIAQQAVSVDRRDLADTARQLATQSPSTRVICHGDLHPFNLLVDDEQWTLVDWSASVIADPHLDLAFTTLMLANPPIGGPAPIRVAARAIGARLADRFLRTYQQLTIRVLDVAVDDLGLHLPSRPTSAN